MYGGMAATLGFGDKGCSRMKQQIAGYKRSRQQSRGTGLLPQAGSNLRNSPEECSLLSNLYTLRDTEGDLQSLEWRNFDPWKQG